MRTSTEEDKTKVQTANLNWAERRVPVGFDGGGDGGSGDGGASEGDQSGAGASGAGASGDGGSGGTQGASDDGSRADFEARFARQEETIRKLQSERDRALAAAKPGSGAGGGSGDGQVDTDALVASIEQRFEHRATMREAAETLGKKYGNADEAILRRAVEFDSAEALEAALEASHKTVATKIESAVAEERKRILAEVEEKYGVKVAPAGGEEGSKSADPTIEQIEAMSLEEMAEFEMQNPGVINRVLSLRSATA